MSEAPERIWVKPNLKQMYDDMESMGGFSDFGVKPVSESAAAFVEYIRADIVREMLRDAMKDKDYEC